MAYFITLQRNNKKEILQSKISTFKPLDFSTFKPKSFRFADSKHFLRYKQPAVR
jgi:hypothetical protein